MIFNTSKKSGEFLIGNYIPTFLREGLKKWRNK